MRSLIAALRVVVLTVRGVVLLPIGLVAYWCSGRTPGFGHQALIWLFCVTQGRSNDFLSWMVSRIRPKIALDSAAGVLGDLRASALAGYLDRLRADGFIVFERALPAEVCDRLTRFALETPAQVRRMDGEGDSERGSAVFDPARPAAVRYDYSATVLLGNPDVQFLLADRSILALSQEYLGAPPVADVLNMWWHTNYSPHPDSQAAQFFHFDMDRIKWLKVFVYLSDVGPENGPHSFVKGSHRTGGIPLSLLLRGYERLSDQDVEDNYPREACMEFSAPRGSIIIEDTRGLHKGAHVRGGPRLILQLQFSNGLFGAKSPRARITRVLDPSLQSMVETAPAIYRQYLANNFRSSARSPFNGGATR
jgi:hypothetical protein